MKTKTKSSIIILLLILMSIFSCKDEIQDILTFNAPEVKTAIVVQVYQAGTTDLIGANDTQSISMKIEGTDKSAAKDIFGQQITSLASKHGIFTFALSNSILPSASKPIELTLIFEGSGFQEASMPIQIVSEGGHSFNVNLLKISSPPEGVSISNEIAGIVPQDGITPEDFNIASLPAAQSNAITRVHIPEGTIIKDINGKALTGEIESQIIYYSNQSADAVACFTGGFCVKTKDENGTLDNALFFTGGWADYDLIDASGNIASTFSNPIDIYFEIPTNTYNPDTKELLKAGDYFPMWNYNLNEGIWEFENEGLVQGPAANGNLFIEYQTTHFSKKNADKKKKEKSAWRKKVDAVKDAQKEWLRIIDNPSEKSVSENTETFSCPDIVQLILKEPMSDIVYWSSGYLQSSDDEIYIPDAPCDLETVLEVWGGCPFSLLGSTTVMDLCTEDPILIELTPPSGIGQLVDVDVTVYANCEFSKIKPNISAFYDDGCGWKYIGQVIDGEITIHGLEQGKGYSFGALVDDFWFDEFFVINSDSYTIEVELSSEICGRYE